MTLPIEETAHPELEGLGTYEYGWADSDVAGASAKRGINEDVVRDISGKKSEPEWMTKLRLKGLRLFEKKPMPNWGSDLSGIDFDNIKYFVRSTEKQAESWEDLPEDIKNTYDKLGIPEAEKQRLVAGVAAQYESEVVYHQIREDLEEQGVIFLDTDTALKEHPELFKEYFGTVIPVGDNKFASLNTAVWSGGSFIYVPKGVHVEIPLQAYFRINTENMGQFERTLIIVDEGAYVHYVEGCTAPIYKSDSLHSAVVEIIVKKNARCRYTTIQNWSNNVYNLVTKRAVAYEGATMEWIDGNIGSKVTMKYPAVYLMGEHAKGETLSIAFAGEGQHQDAGSKMVHMAPNTSSNIVSKSVARGGGRTSYRGLVEIGEGAHGSKSNVLCDALLVDTISRSDTYPYVDVREDDVSMGHEATVSKVSEDQLFYLMSRGLTEFEAMGDDRARLRRADRQGAADGVRPRTQPADRAADGRLGRLRPALPYVASEFRRRKESRPTAMAEAQSIPVGSTTASKRGGSCRRVDRRHAHERTPSFDVADFPVPHGREEEWRFTPLERLRGLHDGTAVATGDGVKVAIGTPGVTVETVGRDDARLGKAGTPVDRVAAQAYSSFEKASVVTVPKETVLTEPIRIVLHGEGGVAYGHQVIELGAFAEAVVVIDHTGDAVLAANVDYIVGDGAKLTVVSVQDWDDKAVHIGQHNALIGRDATFKSFVVTFGGDVVRLHPRVAYAKPRRRRRAVRPVLHGRGPAPGAPPPGRPQHPALQVQRHVQGRAAGRGRPRGLDRRRPHRGHRRGHRHVRDEPQPGADRRRPGRLRAEPGDRDRRDRRRFTTPPRPAASTTSSSST